MLDKIENFYEKITKYLGIVLVIVMILMALNVFYDVVMRYVFSQSSIAMQEMEWHLFSVLILFGVSYALMEEAHVRVDILYERWTPKRKAMINMMGAIIFILPLSLLVATNSVEFVAEAFRLNEISGDPGGLTHRWIIKALIPLSFWVLIFFTFGYFIRNLNIYKKETLKEIETGVSL
ncbi:TRAP transporter small permease subunit [Sulfurovum sp.]|uniref:TRAP transporter small permease subunit n=1 Tax=Sulfurovum sp. TaxID=1969726 RepID=UPI002867F92E|nr:TRAP transporter small permease subunit [Sulfurovum sp.]